MFLAVFLLPAMGVKLGGVLPFLIVLLCPLSHVLMMAMMGKGHNHAAHHGADTDENEARLESARSPVALPAPRDRA